MRIILVLALAVGLVAGGCGGRSDGGEARGGQLEVVAALYPLAEVARVVGGGEVSVRDLTPPGVEPHDVELKPSDVERIHDADLVVVIGGGFQPAVENAAKRGSAKTVEVLEKGERDPHIWLDPVAMRMIVDDVARAFARARPAMAGRFESRAAAYRAELVELDAAFEDGLATCRIRTIVSAHGAFGHLAERYRLEDLGISGIDPSSEPSAARIEELTDLVKSKAITTVFTETLVSPVVAEALAREAGVRTAQLDPIEGLSSRDAEAGVDYLDLMRRNLAALRTALDCA